MASSGGIILMLLLLTLLAIAPIQAEVEESKHHKLIKEEEYELGFITTLLVNKTPLQSFKSKYQQIDVYENPYYFGKILVLDDCIQLTERDAPSYNEMMSHVALFDHPEPKRVLVIGGGDGYVVSEVLKHRSVTHVDHVELDEGVIQISKAHFPWAKATWDDPRVKLHVFDGAQFVRDAAGGTYDVVIQDSSDPFVVEEDGSMTVLPSNVLYTPDHFFNMNRILSENGVLAFQAETYNIPSSLTGIREWRSVALQAGFKTIRYATIAIPTYSTGQIGMYVCNKQAKKILENGVVEMDAKERAVLLERFKALSGPTKYYHPRLQSSCFDLPYWVESYIYAGDETTEWPTGNEL
jgi:spermidine synthase